MRINPVQWIALQIAKYINHHNSQLEERIMSAIDDLNTAITNLDAAAAAAVAKIGSGSTSDAQIEAATVAVTAATKSLTDAVTPPVAAV